MLESLWDSVQSLLGIGESQLTTLQATLRALSTLLVTIAIVRFGSKRLIGKGTAFDFIVAIIIGSTMSRAINGSAPLIGTWVAVAAIIALHWIISWLSSRVTWFGPMLKGKPIEIIRDGEVLRDGLKSAKLSFKDLDQAFREQSKQPDPSGIQTRTDGGGWLGQHDPKAK